MPTSDASLHVAGVALRVNDAERVAAFYRDIIGLFDHGGAGATRRLGAPGEAFLTLIEDADAPAPPPHSAGLFHTAFLLPTRQALGGWLSHARAQGVALEGAADHMVSEALYLSDPEGNGIEVYWDKPRETWIYEGDMIAMVNDPIDLDALAGAADGAWQGVPEGTVIGHVHLRVGDIPAAEAFMTGLGLTVTCRYPKATFYAADDYHHHLATNMWGSAGAGGRQPDTRGLHEVVLSATAGAFERLSGADAADAKEQHFTDPWGTAIRVVRRD